MSDAFSQPINADAQRLSDAPPKPVVRVEGLATSDDGRGPSPGQVRWQEMQDDRARQDPWIDQSHILTREPDGRLVQRARVVGANGEVTAGAIIADETGQPIAGEQDASGEKVAPLEGDNEKFKFGDLELSAREIRELVAHKAMEDSRKALVPAKPQDYKLELPKDLKLPPGVTVTTLNPKDPIRGAGLQMAQNWAHKQGFSQAQFSEMLGVHAASIATEQLMINRAAEREKAALGDTGPARVDAVARFLRGTLGDSDAQPFLATLVRASQVDSWEKIMVKIMNPGGGSFNTRGRQPPDDGKVDDKTYASWSYTEKKEYAERMSYGMRR